MRLKETERLLKIVHELRTQCPWDRKQTHQTLAKYMIEEAYEAVEAMEGSRVRDLMEELGDVLLQVALHAELGKEKKSFDFEKVSKAVADKMVRRHPHIYAGAKVKDEKTHLRNWQKAKEKEKPKKSALDGVPSALPGLQRAQRFGEISKTVGFDWKTPKGVMKKVREEIQEFEEDGSEEEFGDLLFTLVQLARHMKIDSERALRVANDKFQRRFQWMEKEIGKKKKKMEDLKPHDLEGFWNIAKTKVATPVPKT